MTKKENRDFIQMKLALERIRAYMTPKKLRKESDSFYGLEYEEALEMSYENMQQEACSGLKGVRDLKITNHVKKQAKETTIN